MVLDSQRDRADRILIPVARALRNVSPNALSWIAFLAAAFAGIAFYVGGGIFLGLAVAFLFINALLDALDGKVAKLTGKASPRGDFLDHVLDRYADVFMLTGIALSIPPYVPDGLGLLAILGVLLTSYMGTQAQAVGVGRHYGGALGRADRLVILAIAGILQAWFDPAGIAPFGVGGFSFTWLGWTMAVFAVLGNLTAIQRGISAWRRLT
ncbi:MAG TPA: CDP-alcohol phosphatidyltransferase family protein [Thermoplasmata archaeon]|nr:CDP-alcohol phosphatidyltransferase family protein [Thermoplasmata archaeon]